MFLDNSLPAFVQSLPKTETHLHLEGALPFELLQRVRPEFKQPPVSWARNFKFRDFEHFEKELLDMVFSWFTSPEHYHEAARIIFAKHVAQNVKYVESTDDPISFGNTVTDEYVALVERSGFCRKELVQLARNGFEVALMTDAQKKPWLDQLARM